VYAPPRSVRRPVSSPVALSAPALAPTSAITLPAGILPADQNVAMNGVNAAPPQLEPTRLVNEVGDDRDTICPGDKVLLIVENDRAFAKVLLDAAREKGFKGLATSLGASALEMTREYKPDALTLDIFLPDMEGWRVLERLKNDVHRRHIPVCVISTDDARERALNTGALAFVAKPIKTQETVDQLLDYLRDFTGRASRTLLVVEPDPARRDRLLACIDPDGLEVVWTPDGEAAAKALREKSTDCVVLVPELSGVCLERLAEEALNDPPFWPPRIIVYCDGNLPEREDGDWKKLAEIFNLRRVHSPERLCDQAALFLHRDVAKMSEPKRRLLEGLHSPGQILPGKKVLIVDDDMRNIFALSTILEEHDMVIASADNGRDAIKILQTQADIDIVLMDIMMPEMDGIDTMREIRRIQHLKTLPIIAVTAKAMKGDREKCIEAGAWDYLSKPVETDQLLAVLRAWLHR
jgi:CheY-like chemotaxis protein